MKNLFLSFLLVLSLIIGIQVARAWDVVAFVVYIPVTIGVDVTATVMVPSATTAGAVDHRSAYVSQLRDDAAEEIANGGAPTAVLADAIRQIREQTGTQLSDSELAVRIFDSAN